MAKDKTKASSLVALDDGYLDNQTDDGRGGPLSAYFMKWSQRSLNLLFDLLLNKDPAEAQVGVASGNGHDHDGDNSRFIGRTVLAQIKSPYVCAPYFEDKETEIPFDATTAANFDKYTYWERLKPPLFFGDGESTYAVVGDKDKTILRLKFGPGANRARVHVLWGTFLHMPVTGDNNDYLAPALTSGTTYIKVKCEQTSSEVEWSGTNLYTPPYFKWTEITGTTRLQVSENAFNDLTFSTKVPSTTSPRVLVYGVVVTEEHA